MTYWRVIFTPSGEVNRVMPIAFDDQESDWVIVEAGSAEEAMRLAKRRYDADRKRKAKTRLDKESRCVCGRHRDRFRDSGAAMKTCSTCAAREKTWKAEHAERVRTGTDKAHVRNETARVAHNLERQRDRRGEIRLETLIEVRTFWRHCTNSGRFQAWLEQEILAETHKKTG